VNPFACTDCQLRGVYVDLYSTSGAATALGWTNNLVQRGEINFFQDDLGGYYPFALALYNNLFLRGLITFNYYSEATVWTVKDNAFDRMSLINNGEPVSNACNGYVSSPPLSGGYSNVVVTNFTYAVGPLGSHYHVSTNFLDRGSRSGAAARLYFYTVTTNQAPEGGSRVDLGYHYPPVVSLLTVATGTNLWGAVDVDFHPTNQRLIVSVNHPDGTPYNLAQVDTNANVTQWSDIAENPHENPLTTAKATGYGFQVGETLYGSQRPPTIWRVPPDGSAAQDWVTLADDQYWPGGLYVDPTGVFGHDLLLVTGWLESCLGGGVWRIDGDTGLAANIVNLGTCLEGGLVCPTNQAKYGPWAGKLLAGAGDEHAVYCISPDGSATNTNLGLGPHDFHIVPVDQDLYCVRYVQKTEGPSKLLKAPKEFFVNVVDDILIVQSGEFYDRALEQMENGDLFLVHWDGACFITQRITDQQQRWLEHAVFAPVSLPANP
jgi:hypothetical protein